MQTPMYDDLISRIRSVVRRAVPADSTILVVSKGDDGLLEFEGREGWHFPQHPNGAYAGHYPADSASAIAHLESLRARGAEFLVFPATGLWWLDHYGGLREHLERNYRLYFRDDSSCCIFALTGANGSAAAGAGLPARPADELRAHDENVSALEHDTRDRLIDDLRSLFDVSYYAGQVGREFANAEAALLEYLAVGHRSGADPNPLFDSRFYLRRNPDVHASGVSPLVHFVETGAARGADPSPYFDTEYYYRQGPHLRDAGVNPLVHYMTPSAEGGAYHPNPLFTSFYADTYGDVRDSGVIPLVHYLAKGSDAGRFGSHIHRDIVMQLRKSGRSALLRGNWKNGAALLFAGSSGVGLETLVDAARTCASEYHLDTFMVASHRDAEVAAECARLLVLEDFESACEIFRPSAVRFLARSLCVVKPLFAVSDDADVVHMLSERGIRSYVTVGADTRSAKNGNAPLKGDLRSLVGVAAREVGRAAAHVERQRRAGAEARRIVIPCSDWGVSGVNASLEAVGEELIRRGWDVEILFTRDRTFVVETAGDAAHLPRIPHRFLERSGFGVEGMWESLIGDIESRAPCILFMSYDFVANGVVPALTDTVGAVGWVQADDGDYYEQAYRLGRYCNAIVAVSSCIKNKVAALNPALGGRTVVVHNSSVREGDIVPRRGRPAETLKLIYSGRLVQYQKRILDFVDLAQALDAEGVPYSITLIGAFAPRDEASSLFPQRAKAHLDDGRIRLLGRKTRDEIFEQLDEHDFFVLLSEFEGLPLALVEAMARGCVPVVAASDSGIPEVVKHRRNGLILRTRDYAEWAWSLLEVWRGPAAFGRMSRSARRTVRDQFTVERVGEAFDEVFRRVATEVARREFDRPPALTWGERRSPTGDVLPPPYLYQPMSLPGLP